MWIRFEFEIIPKETAQKSEQTLQTFLYFSLIEYIISRRLTNASKEFGSQLQICVNQVCIYAFGIQNFLYFCQIVELIVVKDELENKADGTVSVAFWKTREKWRFLCFGVDCMLLLFVAACARLLLEIGDY